MALDGTSKLTQKNMRKKRSLDDAMASNTNKMYGINTKAGPAIGHSSSYANLPHVFSSGYTIGGAVGQALVYDGCDSCTSGGSSKKR